MNPLPASPGLETRAGQDVELRFLEDLLNDDCNCQSSHRNSTCSHEVTHLVIAHCCGKTWQVCANSAEATRKDPRMCGRCNIRFVRDCWEIRPI